MSVRQTFHSIIQAPVILTGLPQTETASLLLLHPWLCEARKLSLPSWGSEMLCLCTILLLKANKQTCPGFFFGKQLAAFLVWQRSLRALKLGLRICSVALLWQDCLLRVQRVLDKCWQVFAATAGWLLKRNSGRQYWHLLKCILSAVAYSSLPPSWVANALQADAGELLGPTCWCCLWELDSNFFMALANLSRNGSVSRDPQAALFAIRGSVMSPKIRIMSEILHLKHKALLPLTFLYVLSTITVSLYSLILSRSSLQITFSTVLLFQVLLWK